MTEMMKKILEETKRVNTLNTEVYAIVAKKKAEKTKERTKVANYIAFFVQEMKSVLIEADVKKLLRICVPILCNGRQMVLRLRARGFYADFYLAGCEDMWKDGHASLYTYSTPITMIVQCEENGGRKVWECLCDNWSKECEDVIEQAVAAAIKDRLAERMEEMAKALKVEG